MDLAEEGGRSRRGSSQRPRLHLRYRAMSAARGLPDVREERRGSENEEEVQCRVPIFGRTRVASNHSLRQLGSPFPFSDANEKSASARAVAS